jgi:hypothetical protein
MIVYHTADYEVRVVAVDERNPEGAVEAENYRVVNSKYDTVEFRDSQLPNAIYVCDTLQKLLDEHGIGDGGKVVALVKDHGPTSIN